MDLIRPAAEIDRQFAVELDRAEKLGVKILGHKCHICPAGITLGEQVPVQTY